MYAIHSAHTIYYTRVHNTPGIRVARRMCTFSMCGRNINNDKSRRNERLLFLLDRRRPCPLPTEETKIKKKKTHRRTSAKYK